MPFLMYKTLWNEIMTAARRIEYKFLHWGPFVCNYTLTKEEVEAFKLLHTNEDYRKELAGHLQNEKGLNTDEVFKLLFPYLNSYVQGFHEQRGEVLTKGKLELETAWINRQKKNEFNPPHIHDGDLSFVLYTEVPAGLYEECKSSVSNSPGPGCITFDFNMHGGLNKFFLQTHSHLPSVGDVFIFPAGLPHWVYPFKTTEGERVSISGNINLKVKDDSKEK